jgi:hypothetical protein
LAGPLIVGYCARAPTEAVSARIKTSNRLTASDLVLFLIKIIDAIVQKFNSDCKITDKKT